MACGKCGQKKGATRVQSMNKPQMRPVSAVPQVQSNPVSLIQGAKNANNAMRCPTCFSGLKRVSRVGRGDLLQCLNPSCGYVKRI